MKASWTSVLSISALALAASAATAMAEPSAELIAAAKDEGELTTIALPHDWCGYGGVIDSFKAKYGLKVNELNPDAGSGDEVEAIKANKGNKGPQAPDVIDVGLSFGPSAKAEGLLAALQGLDLGHDPGQRQGRRGLLVRRLLRRAGLRGEQGHRQEDPGRLGGPAGRRLRQLRRARRRSAHLEPGDPGRLRRRPVDRAATPPRPPRPG